MDEHRRQSTVLQVPTDTYGYARLPLLRVTEVIETANDLKKRVGCALANAIIVVRQEADEVERALFNIWQEMRLGSRKDNTNRIRCDLLLDADRAVHIQQLLEIQIVIVVNVDMRVVRYVDCIRRGEARCKVRGSFGVRH